MMNETGAVLFTFWFWLILGAVAISFLSYGIWQLWGKKWRRDVE